MEARNNTYIITEIWFKSKCLHENNHLKGNLKSKVAQNTVFIQWALNILSIFEGKAKKIYSVKIYIILHSSI